MATSVPQNQSDAGTLINFDAPSYLVFHSVFDLYGTLDESGNILDLRGRIFEETNAQPELLIRQPFAETVFWQSSERNSRLIEKAVQSAVNGELVKLLLDFRLSADDKCPVELIFQPVTIESGEKRIFVCALSTASRTEQINEYKNESEHLLLAAENAEIGLWFWDHTDDRLYSTPRCNELFDLPAYEELTYEKFLAVVHPDDRKYIEEFLEATRKQGAKYEEEFRVVYSDGSIEWLCAEGKSFIDSNGKPQRMVGVVRKVTEQKLASAELERVYEREKKARDDAEIANRSKDFFLAFVSHELRSPLNAILGWSKILLTREVNEETRKKALETIEKSAQVQAKLINDLVDSARVASGKLRLEYRQVNLVDIVRSSFEAQKPAAETQALNYAFETKREQIVIFGDSGRLQQVFGNLISNAIKFTPQGGSVKVEIDGNEEAVAVTVSDTGQGIDPKGLPDIFKQFAQGDAETTRRTGGLGLGLSIVNILVVKHGGTVKAESDGLGHGSRFTVTLPLTDAAQVTEAPEALAREISYKKLQGIKILIVEDDPDSREVLQIFLEQNGAAIKTVDSARAAMNLFNDVKADRPDILISDLAMPEEDGYSLISRIRELPAEKGGHIPALALSAFASAESRQKAFEAGFHRYLTKPFEPDSIVDQIVALRDLNGRNDETTS
jgi:PAS domain S-box-containing protein